LERVITGKPMKQSRIHAARIEKSERLRATARALRVYGNPTTRQIGQMTGSCAVHTDIAELRANGLKIECRCIHRGRFEYRLR